MVANDNYQLFNTQEQAEQVAKTLKDSKVKYWRVELVAPHATMQGFNNNRGFNKDALSLKDPIDLMADLEYRCSLSPMFHTHNDTDKWAVVFDGHLQLVDSQEQAEQLYDEVLGETSIEESVFGACEIIPPTGVKAVNTDYLLPQMSSANLMVAYSVLTPNTCSIKNMNTLVFNTPGECRVSYTQTGDSNTEKLDGNFSVSVSDSIAAPVNYYEVTPNIKNCKSGVINDATRTIVIDEVNQVRKLHGLEPLVYDKSLEPMVAETALAMAAQNTTSHYVDESWQCYSSLAATGAKQSSLRTQSNGDFNKQFTPAQAVAGWMREEYSDSLGHRRWLLSPFIDKTSFGMADGEKKVGVGYVFGAALYMYDPINYANQTTKSPLGIYPYPVGNYPRKFFQKGDRLSAFVLVDQSSYTKNRGVDYSKAVLVIKDPNGKDYTVSDVKYDISGQGVPNNISFLFPDFDYGINYTVNINNVLVNGVPQNYQYNFMVN